MGTAQAITIDVGGVLFRTTQSRCELGLSRLTASAMARSLCTMLCCATFVHLICTECIIFMIALHVLCKLIGTVLNFNKNFNLRVCVLFKAVHTHTEQAPVKHEHTARAAHALILTNRMAASTACALTVNVGGVLYHTTQSMLCSRGGMLAAIFAPDGPFSFTKSSTSDSTPFIDRDGELFKYILQFLRGGHINLPDAFRSDDRKALRFEAEYYGLDGLLDELNSADGLISALHYGHKFVLCWHCRTLLMATSSYYHRLNSSSLWPPFYCFTLVIVCCRTKRRIVETLQLVLW
jgi:BTB/POZ domain